MLFFGICLSLGLLELVLDFDEFEVRGLCLYKWEVYLYLFVIVFVVWKDKMEFFLFMWGDFWWIFFWIGDVFKEFLLNVIILLFGSEIVLLVVLDESFLFLFFEGLE